MWTYDGSKECDEGRHNDCDGIARFLEQDGQQRYKCACYCHRIPKKIGKDE